MIRRTLAACAAVTLSGAAVAAGASVAMNQGMGDTPTVRTGPAITYAAPAITRIRPSVTSMTADQKRRFVRAILLLKATPSPWDKRFSWYDNFVWWHRKAFACEVDQAHMRPAFLPWHRQFLFMFESALRVVADDPSIILPFWDWTDPAARKVVFAPDFLGPNGDPTRNWAVTAGPFRAGRWHLNVLDPPQNDPLRLTYLTRRFGSFSGAAGLPTRGQVLGALHAPKYDVPPYDTASDVRLSFRNNIEGWRGFSGMTCTKGLMDPVKIKGNTQPNRLHNQGHLWVGGELGPTDDEVGGTMTLNTSLNDPVFWLHHANVDRLWSIWQRIHGEGYAPRTSPLHGQGLNSPMWPWRQSGLFVSPKSVLNIPAMGYTYEDAPAAKG